MNVTLLSKYTEKISDKLLEMLNWVIRYQRGRFTKCDVLKNVILLVAVVLLCKENISKTFLFILHKPDTCTTVWSKWKCVINVQRGVKNETLSEESYEYNNSCNNKKSWRTAINIYENRDITEECKRKTCHDLSLLHFSDEAYLHFDNYINKHNSEFWFHIIQGLLLQPAIQCLCIRIIKRWHW